MTDPANGRVRRVVSSPPDTLAWRAWLPDGKAVAYSFRTADSVLGTKAIVHDLLTGRDSTRFDAKQVVATSVIFSRGSANALYLRKGGILVWRDLATMREREWNDRDISQLRLASVAGDGRAIAYFGIVKDATATRGVLKIWVGSGEPHEVVRTDPSAEQVLALGPWTPDGRFVLFSRRQLPPKGDTAGVNRSPGVLWRVAAAGGSPERLGLEKEGLRDIDIAPDGRHIAFTAGWPRSELRVLEPALPQQPPR